MSAPAWFLVLLIGAIAWAIGRFSTIKRCPVTIAQKQYGTLRCSLWAGHQRTEHMAHTGDGPVVWSKDQMPEERLLEETLGRDSWHRDDE